MKKRIALFVFLTACGSSAPNTDTGTTAEEVTADTTATESQATAKPTAEPQAEPITEVTREQMNAILKKGPAHVLAMVQTDSVKEGGKFVGFKVVSFRTDAPSILGVQPEDIIQRVNGHPVERPEQFLKIFEELKTATEIKFTLLRNGETLTLASPIE